MIAANLLEEIDVSPQTIPSVPIRNIWLLMLYASELFRHLGNRRVAVEAEDDEIPDLVARILTEVVSMRLRQNLSLGYVQRSADLSRLRGQVDLISTYRRQLLACGKIACKFEELTFDTIRNRYVRAALTRLAGLVNCPELKHRCRQLASQLGAAGVSGHCPSPMEIRQDWVGRHDARDAVMAAAAKLALNLALPTELDGEKSLFLIGRDLRWLQKLFERAVGGYLLYTLEAPWQVETGSHCDWPIEERTDGLDSILPDMITDIVLEHPPAGRRIIIDTKFNSIVVPGQYGKERLRSGYIYQIYSYVRTSESFRTPNDGKTAGVLLHPAIGASYFEAMKLHGHEFVFLTVDLAGSSADIRRRLQSLACLTYFPKPGF